MDEYLLRLLPRGVRHLKLLPKVTEHPDADPVRVAANELRRKAATSARISNKGLMLERILDTKYIYRSERSI